MSCQHYLFLFYFHSFPDMPYNWCLKGFYIKLVQPVFEKHMIYVYLMLLGKLSILIVSDVEWFHFKVGNFCKIIKTVFLLTGISGVSLSLIIPIDTGFVTHLLQIQILSQIHYPWAPTYSETGWSRSQCTILSFHLIC